MVPIEEAKRRALAYLIDQGGRPAKLNCIALAIWPDATFTSQGAAGAASRIVKLLQKEGKVGWIRTRADWGYRAYEAKRPTT